MPVIVTLETHAMNYRIAYKEANDPGDEGKCPITFLDPCTNSTEEFLYEDSLIVYDAASIKTLFVF